MPRTPHLPKRWALCLTTVALLCIWLLTCAASSAFDVISVEAYWQLVEETLQATRSATGLPPDQARAVLLPFADRWQNLTGITPTDGASSPLDPSYLAASLRLDPPEPARLQTLLETLLAAQQDYAQSQSQPSDLTALQAILDRPEFQWQSDQPSIWEQWVQSLRERLLELLARLLDNKLVSSLSPLFIKALYFIGPLVLFLVLAYFLRGAFRSVISETKLSAVTGDGDSSLTADAALARAQGLSSAGDYRQAVRYLYLSCLLLLQERGLIPFDRSRTNREYLRSLRGHPELVAVMSEVVDVFDRVWYGFQPLDNASYTHYAERVAELRQQR